MHPIVDQFINTNERLTIILEKYYDKNQYLEVVFFKFGQLLNAETVNPEIYQEIDQAVITGHPDADFYLLFISYTISFISRRKQFERAKILEGIGNSLVREKIHPVLQSYFISSIATLREFESKTKERDLLIKESLSLLDRNNPRYRTILLNSAIFIGSLGRLKEFPKEDIEILETPINKQQAYLISEIKIVNNIILGNVEEGLKEVEKLNDTFLGDNRYRIQIREYVLRIISGDFDEKNYDSNHFKVFANICKNLSMGNFDEAQRYYDILTKESYEYAFNIPFLTYFSINLQLCLRNKGKARLLYHDFEMVDGKFYFDDFYLARLYLLENNKKEALNAFRRLMKNINFYGAYNQLLFLMQFAKELNILDVLKLIDQVQGSSEKEPQPPVRQKNSKLNTAKGIELLVGESVPIKQVKSLIQKFSVLAEPVLIIGETGTGKELVAKAIHDEGPHSNQPFLAINCGALTESLLQSELFGYVAGAFTGAQKERKGIFEAAGNGTVFLDEFGDVSPQMQASLLRLLESNEIRLIGDTKTRKVGCKIVVATNIDLQQAVYGKKFREDLYFRLTRFDIKLPPLRERKEDIPILIKHFLTLNKRPQEKLQQFSKELMEILVSYHWSGNIRELKNEVERLRIMHSEKEILNVENFDFSRLNNFEKPPIVNSTIKQVDKPDPSNAAEIQNDLDHDRILKIVQRGNKIESRQNILKDLFLTYKKISRKQIVEITGMNPGLASKELNNLCSSGFIKKVTPTNSVKSHYFILAEK